MTEFLGVIKAILEAIQEYGWIPTLIGLFWLIKIIRPAIKIGRAAIDVGKDLYDKASKRVEQGDKAAADHQQIMNALSLSNEATKKSTEATEKCIKATEKATEIGENVLTAIKEFKAEVRTELDEHKKWIMTNNDRLEKLENNEKAA